MCVFATFVSNDAKMIQRSEATVEAFCTGVRVCQDHVVIRPNHCADPSFRLPWGATGAFMVTALAPGELR